MKNKKNIICFTNSYPYGNLETFFETELRYLSKAFHTLYIQPTYNPFRSEVQRPVPSNAVVFTPLVPARKLPRFFSGVLNLSPLSMYLRDFLRHKVYYSREKMKRWFNSFLIFRIKYRKAKSLLAGRDQNTILYSCWAEAPLFATKVCSSYPKVVRMHRGDFYLNVRNSYLPVRSSIYKSADLLLPISNDISAILQEHYRIAQEKILVNYVAVSQDSRDGSLAPYHNDILRIVSCSRVDPIKRVHLIGETMMKWKCDRRIEWHHFGDGAEFDKLKRMTVDPPENVDIFLHGWVSQSYLYDFEI